MSEEIEYQKQRKRKCKAKAAVADSSQTHTKLFDDSRRRDREKKRERRMLLRKREDAKRLLRESTTPFESSHGASNTTTTTSSPYQISPTMKPIVSLPSRKIHWKSSKTHYSYSPIHNYTRNYILNTCYITPHRSDVTPSKKCRIKRLEIHPMGSSG